ncbi:MAG: cupin domain-containing protein [Salinivenus sp.]
MSSDPQDLTEAEPFQITKSAEETGGEFVRFEATHYPAPGSAGTGEDLPFHRWANDNADEHVHPNQEERLKVLSGTYRVIIDGTEHTLTEGEEIVCPPNTPHRHFNPTAEPIRTLKEDRPARQSEAFFSALYALAQKGRADEEGLPPFLQFAVLQDAYPGHAYMTDLPVEMQKAMFSALGPVGRHLGYRADVALDEEPAGAAPA